ncbi:MAG TPA: hypothetical protein VGG10_20595 [Rhizomicrobium sp.]|jgi:uncharacterized protein YjlB
MPILEDAKKSLETLTGIARPTPDDLETKAVEPECYEFSDDGETPNNPRFPLLVYRHPALLSPKFDPAAVFEELFKRSGWQESWRDAIYPYNHFHTKTHEVLGIARGAASVRFGGANGKTIKIRAGDVIVIPAGTGHCAIFKSDDLLVVGAYPAGSDYDEPKPEEVDAGKARASIAAVEAPARDPVYGAGGPLRKLWRQHSA